MTIVGLLMAVLLHERAKGWRICRSLAFLPYVLAVPVVGVVFYIGIMLPMSLYLFGNFFRAFPGELLDAAAIDGLGPLQTLLRIVLPASRPVIFTAVVVNFVFAWNELLPALVFLQNEQQSADGGRDGVQRALLTGRAELMAGVTIATIPVVLVYLVGQRHLMCGLLGGIGK